MIMLKCVNLAPTSVEVNTEKRELTTCSYYTDCESCNLDTSCMYQAGVCNDYVENELRYASISTYSVQQYCHNTDYERYFYMNQNDFSADFYQYTNASTSTNPYCQWRVISTYGNVLNLEISKTAAQNELIYMYTNANNVRNFYYPKDFTNCDNPDQPIKIKIENVSYLRIRVETLNDESDYNISISELEVTVTDDNTALIIIWTTATFSLIIVSLLIAILAIWVLKHGMNDRPRKPKQHEIMEKAHFIARCHKNMKRGKFSELNVEFDQDNCVI